jgi:hypothetical protein
MRRIHLARIAVVLSAASLAACSGGDQGTQALAGGSSASVVPQTVMHRPASLRGSVLACRSCSPLPVSIIRVSATPTPSVSPSPTPTPAPALEPIPTPPPTSVRGL